MAKSPDNRERHVPVVTARVISLSQIRMRFGTGSPLGPLTVGPATQPAPTSVRRSAPPRSAAPAPPHARRPALARSRPSVLSLTLASAARRQQRLLPLLFYLSISSLSISLSPSPSPSPSHSLPPARVFRGPESSAGPAVGPVSRPLGPTGDRVARRATLPLSPSLSHRPVGCERGRAGAHGAGREPRGGAGRGGAADAGRGGRRRRPHRARGGGGPRERERVCREGG